MDEKDLQTRRLSAIMFTDMVGYSALAQENEELAIKLLEEHREILRLHFTHCHGREIETVGDAFFVEFGSALEAVHCAILIQKHLYERNKVVAKENIIQVRIGLHVGDVIYRGDQVIGDGVNIASRMEPIADPGGICLSEDVARQIYNKIDYPLINLGKSELKNIRLPIDIFKVELPWVKLPVKRSRSFLRDKKEIGKYLLIFTFVLVILYLGLRTEIVSEWLFKSTSYVGTRGLNRMAVLPFDNFSPDKNDEYLADGMTEEIITVLSKIKNLDVIARTSVMKYKTIKKDIVEIAEDLDVNIVLEGSVRKEKNRIIIIAQLINAKTQDHLWAEKYDENFDHIFELQEDVALQVAKALKVTLEEMDKKGIEKRVTENIEAYNYYLKGRFNWNKRTPERLLLGLEFFNKAIQTDPKFALAYAGVADAYHLLASYGILEPNVAFTQAKNAAIRSLELDETLAEGNNSMAAIHLLYDWDWDKTERRFQEALRLDPRYVQGYLWYAFFLSTQKDFEKAINCVNRAIKLDPLSAIARTDLGQIYYHAGDYEKAIKEYQYSLSLDSTYVYTYAYLGQALAMSGREEEAEQVFKMAVTLTDEQDPATLAGLAYIYAVRGKTDSARAILNTLQKVDPDYYVHPIYIAIIYLGLGDKNRSLNWLERGYQDRSEWMVSLQVEHMLDPLHNKERFKKLIRQMGFRTR